MIKSNLLKAASVLISVGLFACIFYISFISPIAVDTWGHVSRSTDPFNILAVLTRYIREDFLNGNPRIGQLPLRLAGYSPLTTALVNSLSATMVVVAGIVAATGRSFNPLRMTDSALVLVFFATLCGAGAEIGQSLFYVPYTTNYVFGFGLLLTLLAVFRLGSKAESVSAMRLGAVFVIGFLAGMSNEHTPPYVLGAAVCVAAAIRVGLLHGTIRRLHTVAFAGLLLGYITLFFAPGQAVRYGGSKDAGFQALQNQFGKQVATVSRLMFDNSVPFFALAAALLALVVYLDVIVDKKKPRLQPNAAWALFFLIGAFGFAAPLLVSPKIGQRILFASYASLALAIVALANRLEDRPRWRPLYVAAVALSSITLTLYLYRGTVAYRQFASAFAHQSAIVMNEKAKGNSKIRIAKYAFNFKKFNEYTRPEDFSKNPSNRLNKKRAKYYGVSSFAYK